MHAVLAFIRLARLPFLYGGFVGFGLGAAVAHFDGSLVTVPAYVWGQALVTSFHLMVHFANEYYDQETDARTERTAWSGGSGVLASGALPPATALIAALVCAAIGVSLTIAAALRGDFALAGIAVAIAILAWSYSAPPMRLLARGLGEAATMIVVAVLVPLAGYATFAGTTGTHALVATIPGALAMIAMMLAVELPDRAADTATNKRNLVVRCGEAWTTRAIRIAAVTSFVALILTAVFAFHVPEIAYVAVIAPAYALQRITTADVLRAPFANVPFAGVLLYATTTTCMLAMVAITEL